MSAAGEQAGAGGGTRFLPNFCGIRLVLAVVFGAELLAIVLTLFSVRELDQVAGDLSMRSLFIQWIALAGAGALCAAGRWLNRLSPGVAGLTAWTLLQGVIFAVAWVAVAVMEGVWPDYAEPGLILRTQGIGAIASALMLRYLFVQHRWRQQVEAESRARLQALQARIRPHFLFNSMNTIANLTRSDPALAERVVEDLSDLFRASLSDSRRPMTLGDELELVRGYLRIEAQRLGDRLRVEWDLEALPLEAVLPGLTLQPLVENAVYHGIERSTAPGTVRVSGRYRRRRVNIGIRNTYAAGDPPGHREGNRMALENIRLRLQGHFGGQASLTVGEVDGEYQVRLVFPHPWSRP